MFDRRAARVLFTAIAIGLMLLFVWAAWRTIIAFVFSIFFAYLLEAPVERLTPMLRGSRKTAIGVVYLLMLGIIAAVLTLAAPRIMREAQSLVAQMPQLTQKLSTGQIAYSVGSQRGWSHETQERLQQFLAAHQREIVTAFQGLVAHAARTLKDLWWLVLVPILAIFFLLEGGQFRSIIVNAAERGRYRSVVGATVTDISVMLGHFIRAQLALALLAIVVLTLVFWATRVPYAFAVGPAAGALEFIPVVGPLIGAGLVLAVAFVTNYPHLLILVIVLIVWRGIQDYITSPRIMGSKLELHPLAVLFGVLAGGEVGGVIGVFLSIPILAAGRILWRAWRAYCSATSDLSNTLPVQIGDPAPITDSERRFGGG